MGPIIIATCALAVVSRLVLGQSLTTSTDGSCAGSTGETCQGSRWGNCCSPAGFCGQNQTYCGAGCQQGFGSCYANVDLISTDGSCAVNGTVCLGSIFGNCCSSRGFCGSSSVYCGSGCQSAYGACGDAAASVTVSTVAVSTGVSTATSASSSSSSSSSGTRSVSVSVSTLTTSASSGASTGTAGPVTTDQSHQSVTSTAGFKAGMAVLAVVLAAVIAALLWFFLIRKPSQRKAAQHPPSYPYQPTHDEKKDPIASNQSELSGFPVVELPGNSYSTHSDLGRAELPVRSSMYGKGATMEERSLS